MSNNPPGNGTNGELKGLKRVKKKVARNGQEVIGSHGREKKIGQLDL